MRFKIAASEGTAVLAIWRLLEKKDQRKIKIITLIQASSGALDLLGVLLIGVVGAVAVNGLGPQQTGSRVSGILDFLHLSEKNLQTQVAVLAIAAASVLVIKTGFSVYFTKRILNYLSHQGAILSSRLVASTFKMPLLKLQEKPQQETLFAITGGPALIMVGILGNLIAITADVSLLIILAGALFAVNVSVALASILLFSTIGYLVYQMLHSRAQKLGKRNTELGIASSTKILEVFSSYRVLFVRGRRDFYAKEVSEMRLDLGRVVGESAFIPYISKYVIEAVIVLGSLALAASQFLLKDVTHAIATLTIFLAAGSRIAPASLRIQQGALEVKKNLGICRPTLDYIHQIGTLKEFLTTQSDWSLDRRHQGFLGNVQVKNVSFRYSKKNVLSNVSFSVKPGEFVSIVGPSGSGKSTLADLVLGIIEPEFGSVEICGVTPNEAIQKWPGSIAYVPQEVNLISGTIKENIIMGFNQNEVSDEIIQECLKVSKLEDFVKGLPDGFHSEIGERGAKLSGGQKQRLGIARALVTNPQLIIFDEATSALDGVTEADISSAIQELKGSVSIIMIAHRLSTVRNSDEVIYLSEGNLLCKGSFDYVRSQIPDFDAQASLMGL